MDALSLSVWGKNLMDYSLTVIVQFGKVKSNHHEEHEIHEEKPFKPYPLIFFVSFVVKRFSMLTHGM